MDKVIFGIAETDILKNINEGINYIPRKIIWLNQRIREILFSVSDYSFF